MDWKLHLLQSLFFLLLELVLFEFNLLSLVKNCLMEPLWNKLKRNYLKFVWPSDSLLDKFVGSGAANLLVDSEQGCLALLWQFHIFAAVQLWQYWGQTNLPNLIFVRQPNLHESVFPFNRCHPKPKAQCFYLSLIHNKNPCFLSSIFRTFYFLLN